jgi:hypothetical protein
VNSLYSELSTFALGSLSSPSFYHLVQQRLKSVQNIEKITKSMKMIASTKVAKAQKAMENARAFGSSSSG